MGTTAFGPGVENPVALVVDDVYYASALFGLTDLADIEQVAVLKGPQGTLFGRNATGGVIQLTTREPNGEVGGELRTSLDNYLTSRSFAYLTGRVADNLNANLSVKFTTQGNGWGTNIRTGEDIRKIDHDLALRTKLAWAPGSETKINLALDYTSRKNSLGANLRPVPGYSTFFSSLDDPGVESDLQDVDTNITNRNRFKGGGASLTVNQGLGFATLSSISAYREYSNSIAFSAAGTNFPVVEVMPGSHWYGKQFTQEVRLISPSSSKLKWQIGGFYFWSNEGFDPLSETIFTNPAAPYSLKLDNSFKASSYALFGQATLPMGDATNFTAGIRYTHEERSASGRLDYTALGAGPPPPNSVVNASFDESRVTFRLALDHRIADDVMAYASFNRGFKSGGFDPFLTQTVPYRSEALDAYEVGLKAELLGKSLRINPSLFLNKYNDIQVSYIVGANAFIDNAAKAELYGIDLDVEWQVTNRLKLGGSLSYVHNEFTDYPNAPTTFPDPVFILLPGTIANARGNNLPYAPEFTYNLSLDYSIPLQKGDLAFNFTDSYSSSYASEPDNRLKQKAFHYLNAALTYTNDSGDLSLSIWGRNLLDEIVVSQLASYAFLGDIADYGNPRERLARP
ncbi:TonB-dependent receptor [Novosphingobium sp. MW5]|nr:TonB-dependent receptor [Novosphingobium sp. MW5]